MELQQLIDHFENIRTTAKHPLLYLTGQGGTGKTYNIKKAIEQNPRFAKLAASTGIAGVNLGATTINQVLKYFNTDSLSDAYQTGQLQRNLRRVREEANFLVIDECSMIPYQQLNFLIWALDEINSDGEDDERLGVILTGDFGQLAPVPGNLIVNGRPVMTKDGQRAVKEPTPWAFKSEEWAKFDEEGHTVKLEKIYRQSDPVFLEAINTVRRGVGKAGAGLLVAAGVEFARELDNHFDGTTIVAKNEEVDRINKIRLSQLPGTTTYLPSDRWWATQVRGWKQPSEWDYIPDRLELKPDAYVMVLANQKNPITGELIVANGDCGWVREIQQLKLPKYEDPEDPTKITSEDVSFVVMIELARKPGELVTIASVCRPIEQRYEPEEDLQQHPKFPKDDSGKPCKVRSSSGRLVWCLGWVDYFPLRLAYASTVHKCLSIHSKVLHREKGRINLNKVEPGDYILGRNSWVKVKAVQMVGKKRCYRITIGARQINCSAEHRFPVNIRDGSDRLELIQAQYLYVGQRLCLSANHGLFQDMSLVKPDAEERWEEISKIELLDEISMVDIEVESTDHLFYADGILNHNSQGLSLDRVQIDPRGHFFGQPGMAYVSLSRGRTPQGIRIVGSSNLFAERVNTDPAVRRFL